MKKLAFLLIAFFVISAAQAQKLKIGIKAGPSIASIYNHKSEDVFSYKLKFHAGLMGNMQLADIIYFQPEILYSQKGFEYKDGSNTFLYKLDYVDVPLMLQGKFDNVFLELGPQVSFLVSGKRNVNGNDQDINSSVKSTVGGVNAGIGYMADNITIGLRYSADASNTFVKLFDRKTDARNSVFMVSLGYFLP